MKLQAVIGAQFGDEGKGLVTDYLATKDTLVVRANGGAQAGHTVVTPEGHRHEFHHIGAGTFQGAQTLLTRHFIANPILFIQEHTELKHHQVTFIDEMSRITTPLDMLINRAVEESRGAKRHGSCGLGIHETVVRSELPEFALYARDLSYPDLAKKVRVIEEEYFPTRCKQLEIEIVPRYRSHLMQNFLECCAQMCGFIHTVHDAQLISTRSHVLFENAQGLRLDAVNGVFPHVTCSRTGLTNIEELLCDIGKKDELLEVFYVTRSYVTRHGAGPLTGEVTGHPFGWVGPETNVENLWQGSLRYAPLNTSELKQAIETDLEASGLTVSPRLVVTCLDQLSSEPEDGDVRLVQAVYDDVERPVKLISYGPTRDHVRSLD